MTMATADPIEATLWRSLLEDTGASVLAADRAGRLHAVNCTAAQTLGREPGELIGTTYAAATPPHVQAERLGYLREAIDTQRTIVVDGFLRGVYTRTTYRPIAQGAREEDHPASLPLPVPGALIIEYSPGAGAPTSSAESPTRAGNDDARTLAGLTKREREVLRLIGQGLSTADIARTLHRSAKTIEWHRVSLGNKLGINNRVELARIALRAGLSTLEDLPPVADSD